MTNFPSPSSATNRVEPVPRRIRAVLGGETVFDTIHARYVWEWPYYPQYYIPLQDVLDGALRPDGHAQATRPRTGRAVGLCQASRCRLGQTLTP